MNGNKFFSPFRQSLDRLTRIVLLCWGFIIAIGALATYFRPLLPWVAGVVSLGVMTWVVIAIVRWWRSKW